MLAVVLLTHDDHLWIRTFPTGPDDETQAWLVLNPDRSAIARVVLPGIFNVKDVRDEFVLVVRKDHRDIENLEVYNLRY